MRPPVSQGHLTGRAEFSGTLLGFDDYVSKYTPAFLPVGALLIRLADMVLEDVTELYVP